MKKNLYVGNKTKVLIMMAMLLFTVLCISFIFTAKGSLESEKSQYLEEVSKQNANVIEAHIQGDLMVVKTLATFMSGHETFDIDHTMPILEAEVAQNGFKRIGIAFPDGHCITTDHYQFDVSARDWFKKAFLGETILDAPLKDFVDGKDVVVLASPIRYKGNIRAVLFATESAQIYSESLKEESFNGEGYSYMISGNGDIIVKTTHKNSMQTYENLFNRLEAVPENKQALDHLRRDIKEGKNGSAEFIRGGKERIASYTKTHINDWYVVSVVPTAVVSQYAKKLIYQISIAVIVMIFVALAGICWIAKFYRESQEKLERIAFEDPLTGHCNLNKFTLECEDLFEKAHTNSYAILQFDVNNFKGINDVYGYEKGNQLLQYIGHVVNDELQGGEYWARLSTDQFICLVQYESDSSIIQRIAVISERVKNFIGDYHVELTFGIYQVKNMKLSVSSMNDKASLARLEIKKGERSCNYNFYSESIKKRIAWERDIESSFSKGIGEKEFQVFLQPKYAFRGGEIVGAEALVRWRKPGNLLVTPDKFIPILEKNGRIIKLDLYMFEEVCSLLDKWQCNLPISVNFSRVDFKQNDLEDQLLAITKKHHVNPKLLEIEITESAVIDELELLKKTILKLKSVGFIVSIDDFGSGYSSLNTLRNLDIDAIKIDRGFLDETLEEEKGKKIIKNLLIMAKELSLVTVAEGVETKEQADFLIEAGCDIAQGYYYAKPMPIEDFKHAYRKF